MTGALSCAATDSDGAAAMKIYVLSYVATALVFVAIDAVWLTLMSNALYRPLLGDILLEKFNPAPAVLFYLLYFGGIVYFAITPAMNPMMIVQMMPISRSSMV